MHFIVNVIHCISCHPSHRSHTTYLLFQPGHCSTVPSPLTVVSCIENSSAEQLRALAPAFILAIRQGQSCLHKVEVCSEVQTSTNRLHLPLLTVYQPPVRYRGYQTILPQATTKRRPFLNLMGNITFQIDLPNMCVRVQHKYGCGHSEIQKAPCADSKAGGCKGETSRVVQHSGNCPRCGGWYVQSSSLSKDQAHVFSETSMSSIGHSSSSIRGTKFHFWASCFLIYVYLRCSFGRSCPLA